MEAYRIRIIHQDSSISLRDYSFSQVVAMIKDLSPANNKAFWDKKSVDTFDGKNILFVSEV
jgi:hypothetical protein